MNAKATALPAAAAPSHLSCGFCAQQASASWRRSLHPGGMSGGHCGRAPCMATSWGSSGVGMPAYARCPVMISKSRMPYAYTSLAVLTWPDRSSLQAWVATSAQHRSSHVSGVMAVGSSWPLVAMTGQRYKGFMLMLEKEEALLQLAHSQPALWQGSSQPLTQATCGWASPAGAHSNRQQQEQGQHVRPGRAGVVRAASQAHRLLTRIKT